jgi:hypothetical protein
MTYRITGLAPDLFAPLARLSNDELAAHGAQRVTVTESPGVPDRVSLTDLPVGATALLVHYEHQPANTPFRASHAISVSERPGATYDAVDRLPPVFESRLLSLRGFDSTDMLISAEVVDGCDADKGLRSMLAIPEVAYVHTHFAKPGCYAALVTRA